MEDLENFVRGYIACALWSSNDESDESGGEPLDKNYDRSDIAAEALASMRADCERFMRENADDLTTYCVQRRINRAEGTAMDYAGHDFWLTRNGHGAGFWDRTDVVEDVTDRLTKASEKFGECNLYVGDDGKIYL